jgi:two-component system NtrC family sensor kinase
VPTGKGLAVQGFGELQPILAAVIETSIECVVLVGEDGRVLAFNPAAEAAFGYTRDEAIGQPICELIIPHHLREAHERGFERYLTGGIPRLMGRRVEIEALHRAGHNFPVELTLTEVKTPQGRVFTASIRDVTAIHARQRELDETRRRLELAIDAADLGTWTWDLDTQTGLYTDRSKQMVGLPPDAVLDAAAVRRFVHPEDWHKVTDPYTYRFRDGDRMEVEWRVVLPGGGIRWLHTIGKAERDADGVARTVNGVHIDITARKQAESELLRSRDALHQSEKLAAMGSLLAGVSHELNNPLSAIIGQAQMLEEDSYGTELEPRARKIRAAAERCAKIVQTFLAMARRRDPQRRLLHPNELIRTVVQLAEYSLKTAGIAVELKLAARLPPVNGDSDQLHQVLLNLIINAQQSLERSGLTDPTLTVRSLANAQEVVIEISDNGPGVPPDVASRIFEPFFTTKPQGSGTGVGLSFSQGIVEAHGGALTLEPSARGARFRIAIPAAPAGAVATDLASEEGEADQAPRASALVVDDEDDVAETLGELLQRQGFHVVRAHDGASAMAVAAQHDFDLILSDLRMPGVGGADFYRQLREARPEAATRLAFVTGDTLGASMTAFLQECDRPVLEKPFTREGLQDLIARVNGDAAA